MSITNRRPFTRSASKPLTAVRGSDPVLSAYALDGPPAPHTDDVPDWSCSGSTTPDLWFPTTVEQLDQARTVCAGCPARAVCAQRGLALKADGVWGGTLLSHGRPTDELFRPSREPARATA